MRRQVCSTACALVTAFALSGCSSTPSGSSSPTPAAAASLDPQLEELRAGFVEGLVATAPQITEAQADCAFDEAARLGVTFDDFIAIESSPELEARFAAAFRACGIG